MQDLLREEEFLPKQKTINPWKRFSIFYFLAAANLVLIFVSVKVHEIYNMSIALVGAFAFFSVLLFLIMPFLMIFHWKDNSFLSKSVITLSIFLLMLSYSVAFIAIAIFDSGYQNFITYHLTQNLTCVAVILGYGVLSCLIIIPIINRKQRALKK